MKLSCPRVRHKSTWNSGATAPRIINFGPRWSCVGWYTSPPLYFPKKSSRYTMSTKLGAPHIRPRHFEGESLVPVSNRATTPQAHPMAWSLNDYAVRAPRNLIQKILLELSAESDCAIFCKNWWVFTVHRCFPRRSLIKYIHFAARWLYRRRNFKCTCGTSID
jgi:hypothetical protein